MSRFHKSLAQANFSACSSIPHTNDVYEEEDQDALNQQPEYDVTTTPDNDNSSESSASSASTCTIKPNPHLDSLARAQVSKNPKALSPIPWTECFQRELFIESKTEFITVTHHAYLTSPLGAAPLFITHHGAGSSGLSFALLATEIRKKLPLAGILSLDARGHGHTKISPKQDKVDLSIETLGNDLLLVLDETMKQMQWNQLPPLVLLGHSLGGAVITDIAVSGRLGDHLLGYVVIDVVEGSAIEALKNMQTYLATRPVGFASLESGIEWHLRSRALRNSISARTSVPDLLHRAQELLPDSSGWTWRTDLASTKPFWEDWFVGLSKKFLQGKAGKLLLLAGTDRLDTELMIGQMQGKYAMQVFPEAGHFIHEDLPEKTANVIVEFYKRNDRSLLVLPPKVSDLQRAGKKV
ncbi:Protein phosphatase methylesterase 1 [Podosphaera aphanis]|nr:Protein phosphatase methylesterase 1 [Podosphaera aphanis]